MSRLYRQTGYQMKTDFKGLTIIGCPDFVRRTGDALDLLTNNEAFEIVRPYLAVIRNHLWSGLHPFPTPTFRVGRRTWTSPTIWYASTIVHDACHSMLFHQSRPLSLRWLPFFRAAAWSGKDAEIQCLRLQLDALCELNADRSTVEYVEGIMQNPTYHKTWFRDW